MDGPEAPCNDITNHDPADGLAQDCKSIVALIRGGVDELEKETQRWSRALTAAPVDQATQRPKRSTSLQLTPRRGKAGVAPISGSSARVRSCDRLRCSKRGGAASMRTAVGIAEDSHLDIAELMTALSKVQNQRPCEAESSHGSFDEGDNLLAIDSGCNTHVSTSEVLSQAAQLRRQLADALEENARIHEENRALRDRLMRTERQTEAALLNIKDPLELSEREVHVQSDVAATASCPESCMSWTPGVVSLDRIRPNTKASLTQPVDNHSVCLPIGKLATSARGTINHPTIRASCRSPLTPPVGSYSVCLPIGNFATSSKGIISHPAISSSCRSPALPNSYSVCLPVGILANARDCANHPAISSSCSSPEPPAYNQPCQAEWLRPPPFGLHQQGVSAHPALPGTRVSWPTPVLQKSSQFPAWNIAPIGSEASASLPRPSAQMSTPPRRLPTAHRPESSSQCISPGTHHLKSIPTITPHSSELKSYCRPPATQQPCGISRADSELGSCRLPSGTYQPCRLVATPVQSRAS